MLVSAIVLHYFARSETFGGPLGESSGKGKPPARCRAPDHPTNAALHGKERQRMEEEGIFEPESENKPYLGLGTEIWHRQRKPHLHSHRLYPAPPANIPPTSRDLSIIIIIAMSIKSMSGFHPVSGGSNYSTIPETLNSTTHPGARDQLLLRISLITYTILTPPTMPRALCPPAVCFALLAASALTCSPTSEARSFFPALGSPC